MNLSVSGIIEVSVSVFLGAHIKVMSKILLMIFLAVLPSLSTAGYCLEEWACWEARRSDQGVEFWVINKKPFTFTATIDVKTTNLRGQTLANRHEATEVVAGHSERLLLSLNRIDQSRPFRYRDIFYWTPGDMEAKHADVQYQLPFEPGRSYPMVQGFGGGWSHQGASRYAVDFAMPVGTPVHAARAGMVVQTVDHHNRGGASRRYAAYANYIVVLHEDGTTGEYHHLKKDGVLVSVGEQVEAGDHIGFSGNTGFSSLPHLHFAVYRPQPMGDFESLPFEFVDGVPTRRWWQ